MVAVAVVAAGAISAGVSAYSSSKANKAANKQAKAAGTQAELARNLAEESDPLRSELLGQYENFLTLGILPPAYNGSGEEANTYGLDEFLAGGEIPEALGFERNTAYNRDVLEQQFQRARENTLNAAPAQGGRLADSLTDLEGQRALGITGLESQASQQEQDLRKSLYSTGLDFEQNRATRRQRLRDQLFGQAAGAGFGPIGPALQGLGNAAAGFGGAAQSFGNQAGQALDIAGTALGYGIPALQQAFAPQPYYPQGVAPPGGQYPYGGTNAGYSYP